MRCKKCDYEIIQETNFCPNCGESLQGDASNIISLGGFKTIFSGIVIIGSVLIYFMPFENLNFSTNKLLSDINSSIGLKNEEPKANEIIYISSSQLLKEYKDHELKANEKYKNKYVEVSGKILNISEVLEEVVVTIETKQVDYDLFFDSVQCYVSDENEIKKLTQLEKGDFVFALGKVDGYNNVSQGIEIDNCIFSKKSRKNNKKEDKK